MPKEDTTKKGLTAAQKQKRALELRIAGKELKEIAAEVGYAGESGAHKAIMTALKKTLQEPADELRKMEAERLDKMMAAIWEQATSGSANSTWFIDRILNIMDRRAKLLGLDKPASMDTADKARVYLDLLETARADAVDMSE